MKVKEMSHIEQIKNFPKARCKFLKKIVEDISKKLNGKRKITYLDIINNVSRTDLKGDEFNKLLLWCNYNIRLGKYYVQV